MLTDSKVRQAGFIRNSSSRKVLHQQEVDKRQNVDGSDDSFSSFEYDGGNKGNYDEKEQREEIKQYEQPRSVQRRAIRPPIPHIPPKPQKKGQIRQLSFTNERLKSNFFDQQPLKISNSRSKQKIKENKIPIAIEQFPRIATPQFQQNKFAHKLQEVQNICNRMGSIKVIQGNFSFNPKTNRLKKDLEAVERQGQGFVIGGGSNMTKNVRQQIGMVRRPKLQQNNYFNNTINQQQNEHRFEYDLQPSSQQSQQQSYDIDSQQQQQQQREIAKTLSRNNFPQKQYQSQKQQHQATKIRQNEQSENNITNNEQQEQEQLITDYNKTEFKGMKQPFNANNKIDHDLGVIQKHGGICFQVDVKQFNHNHHSQPFRGGNNNYNTHYDNNNQPLKKPTINYTNVVKKKKKVNQKQQLLRRRQMAKIYSKQARFRLFGFS